MLLKTFLFKILYWYISTVDRKREVIFMNYGYHDEKEKLELPPHDEVNRYPIQLYHRLARMTDISNKNIVEVGCGRGGGLAYITRQFSPASALGIDLNSKAASFGNKNYKLKGLTFMQGDAQSLNLPDASIDVLINVESSHRYPKVEMFFDEVYRVLKPGGYFLYTDFRHKHNMEILKGQLSKYDYKLFDEQIINEQVKVALELDSNRREVLVRKLAPFFLRKTLRDFAGREGSTTYKDIATGELVYYVLCFRKPEEKSAASELSALIDATLTTKQSVKAAV